MAGWSRADLVTRPISDIEASVLSAFLALVEERVTRRPIQHLIGTQAFWRHDFVVTRDVLTPRPETELVVEAALDALRAVREPLIVDVGTGSGAIALSIAAERADARVHAIDISAPALAVARVNAGRLRLGERVRFHLGDLLEPMRDRFGTIDLVASNPPYVDPTELAGLAPEVKDHEPTVALVADGDRYSVYRRLVPVAAEALRPGGWLMMEAGLGMADEVSFVCASSGLEVTEIVADLQGLPRLVVARRPTTP